MFNTSRHGESREDRQPESELPREPETICDGLSR
jgi:hypothetical protein